MKWRKRPVSQLCIFAIDCVNKTAPTVDYETPFKMIRTTNVKGGFIDLTQVRFVTEHVFRKWTRRSRPVYGDVILTREAPVGEVGRFTATDDQVMLGQRLFHYRPNQDLLDWNYLSFVLQSREIQGRLQGIGFGATVGHIRVGDAESLEIPCPPVEVQRRIGSLLATYDDLIENNRRRIALLEEAARLLYREWFVHFRFPGHEHVKVTDGVPAGWEKICLGKYAPLAYGKALREDQRVEGRVPVYGSSGNVGNHSTPLVEGRGIVVGRKGNVGAVHYSEEPFWPIDTTYFVEGVRATRFLFFTLSRMTFMSTDVAVPGLNRAFAHSRELVVPPEPMLTAFEEEVASIYRLVRTLARQAECLSQARDLLLPRLMSGELEV